MTGSAGTMSLEGGFSLAGQAADAVVAGSTVQLGSPSSVRTILLLTVPLPSFGVELFSGEKAIIADRVKDRLPGAFTSFSGVRGRLGFASGLKRSF